MGWERRALNISRSRSNWGWRANGDIVGLVLWTTSVEGVWGDAVVADLGVGGIVCGGDGCVHVGGDRRGRDGVMGEM